MKRTLEVLGVFAFIGFAVAFGLLLFVANAGPAIAR